MESRTSDYNLFKNSFVFPAPRTELEFMTNSFTFFIKKIIPCLVLIIQKQAKLKQLEREKEQLRSSFSL